MFLFFLCYSQVFFSTLGFLARVRHSVCLSTSCASSPPPQIFYFRHVLGQRLCIFFLFPQLRATSSSTIYFYVSIYVPIFLFFCYCFVHLLGAAVETLTITTTSFCATTRVASGEGTMKVDIYRQVCRILESSLISYGEIMVVPELF